MRKKRVLIPIFIGAILVLAIVAPNGVNRVNVHDKQLYWGKTVDTEIPVGSTQEFIQSWAKGRNINLQENTLIEDIKESDGYKTWLANSMPYHLHAALEHIPTPHDFACSDWSVMIDITLVMKKSIAQKVTTFGNCL